MKKETVSGRGKVIAGGLLAALCAIVCMTISVPTMADVRISSEGLTEYAPEAQQPATGTIAGHEYVDLGLSVKWATCNVGASSPSDYGDYFAWGETTPKSEYTKENSKTWEMDLGDISGNPQYDAARANWGGSWRLPTKDEIQELVDRCTWTAMSQRGHNGYKVTSKINGNSIFLPAAGGRDGSLLKYEMEYGGYYSSTPYDGNSQRAYGLGFYSDRHGRVWGGRELGFSVRPVFNGVANADNTQPYSAGENNKQQDNAKVKPSTGTTAGHDWVDLGLSVKWATCNVGASSPSDYGDYFAWGETTPKSEYTQENCKTWERNLSDIAGSSQYDAARANWGIAWRLPTKAEMQELVDKCDWTWTSQGDYNGYKITSKVNGSSIFLPATGWRDWSSHQLDSDAGSYWCSAPNRRRLHRAYGLYFLSGEYSDTPGVGDDCRFFGQSVRPVLCESGNNDNEQSHLAEEKIEQKETAKLKTATGTIAGHEYVDLGLSVKWATCNVGASSPSEYGDYFAWGETTTPKSTYTQENSKTSTKTFRDIAGNPQYDAARANWGGSWRMPTKKEIQELLEKCTWTLTAQGGHNGYKVTSKINGNSIFIPASGWYSGTIYGNVRVTGGILSSTPSESDRLHAYGIGFNLLEYLIEERPRHYGHCVRPVSE